MRENSRTYTAKTLFVVMLMSFLSVLMPVKENIYADQVVPEGHLRVHYYSEEGNYEPFGLWIWNDVASPSTGWPDGATPFNLDQVGDYGAYVDIPLTEGAKDVGFLVVNRESGAQTGDMGFSNLDQYNEVYIREGDQVVYTSKDYTLDVLLQRAELLSEELMEIGFSTTGDLTRTDLMEAVSIVDVDGNTVEKLALLIMEGKRRVRISGAFPTEKAPYTVTFEEMAQNAAIGWRLKDQVFAYDGKLGLTVLENGEVELKLWSPSADAVNIVLYHKDNQYEVVQEGIAMELGEKGVWSVILNEDNTGVTDLLGYYYHYEIDREGTKVLALDPYAASMAAWNSSDPENNYIGKAAIVDLSAIGPDLDFAEIEGFEKREDAIIYELHVRDFTSDPNLEGELTARFGTFAAFREKLDYIEDLGVTHIQLLPVMSYFFANEYLAEERLMDYASTNTNYNWGYDPQSYFSLTGMYSENPEDAAKRVEEFKLLIQDIHSRGMGIILDVVYNHTARVHIFEDLEPNYYHFMDADGTPRVSFGGGRLGTTHHMSRKVLVDSILHWVENYKVDGFRFDMMGDHDAETIQMAYDKAKEVNPNILMIGEGWVTYVGDEGHEDVQAADQKWMRYTESVGSFSDDIRNELKSGFGSEGEPRFLTGGPRDIKRIFRNLTAAPDNFVASNPGDVVPYIAAHDNLTLHDVIAQSIKKDPKDHEEEIHQRIRLGNLMVLTSQGTPFIHGGQEYGRTKQFLHEDFKDEVAEGQEPYKSTFMASADGTPFVYPYFIHDSYDSSDAVNRFDWAKATDVEAYPIHTTTRAFTKGMIALRRSTDAFRHGTMNAVGDHVSLVDVPEIAEEDLAIVYHALSSDEKEAYYVLVNADDKERTLTLPEDVSRAMVLVDGETAGVDHIASLQGVSISGNTVTLAPLTASIIKASETVLGGVETPAPGTGEETDDMDKKSSSTGVWVAVIAVAALAGLGFYYMKKKGKK